ncbi:MAG TPA: biopolymer transporter ExbD [Candidatus Acidoferrales bacterium]|nr:biopolymer transporter ExbD [Candidatus Acidoferrales bacterium]
MKHALEVCLIAFVLTAMAGAQDPTKPMRRPGVTVQMPVSSQAVEMPAADEEDATVVTVTADGKLFLGLRPVELSALSSLNESTVYVKADAQARYQSVLTVLDALRGRQVVLLTAPTVKAAKDTILPPYGLQLKVGAQ